MNKHQAFRAFRLIIGMLWMIWHAVNERYKSNDAKDKELWMMEQLNTFLKEEE